MDLTKRQRNFLTQFLDLYREVKTPLHYTLVARRLGIGNVTAYEMLRLLEKRGFVASKYELPRSGPGRSNVVFYPTERAITMAPPHEKWASGEWERIKEGILSALRRDRDTGYEKLLNEILTRLPGRKSPLLYAADMVTAVILTIYRLLEKAEAKGVFAQLRSLGFPGEWGLNALAGLTLGLTLVEKANRRLTSLLLSYVGKYQRCLAELGFEERQVLTDFAQEVMEIVGA